MILKGFLPFDCDEQKDGTLNIYGNEGGLKTVVGTISYEKYSFKIVFVEPIDFEGKKKSQVQEVNIFYLYPKSFVKVFRF